MNRTDKEAEEVGSLFGLPDVDLPFGLQLRVSLLQGFLLCGFVLWTYERATRVV